MKHKNEVIIGIALVLAFISLTSNFIVIKQLQQYDQPDITGEATISSGRGSICINHPPSIDLSDCNSTYAVDIVGGVQTPRNYTCNVTVSDAESTNITGWVNTTLFNITNGTIDFMPTRYQLGTYKIPFYIDDGFNCSNSITREDLDLQITYNNSAPQFLPFYPGDSKRLVLRQYYTTYGTPLSSYFTDRNGDELSFTIIYIDSHCFNIRSEVDNVTNQPIYNPGSYVTGAEGPCRAYLQAWDNWSGTNSSNIFNITVIPTIIPEPEDNPQSSGGGGGGGAPPPEPICVLQNVTCTNWTPCMFNPPPNNFSYEGPEDGIQTRECSWYTNCPGEMKPALKMVCDYIPTCFDGLLNQKEEKIDCGGPCPPCPTCDDGILNQEEEKIDCGGPCDPCPTCDDRLQNQGEEGVDCGGPCPACMTCDDGIQNQGEEGIDCGGPCPECVNLEFPLLTDNTAWVNYLLILVLAGLIGMMGFHYRATLANFAHVVSPGNLILPFIVFKRRVEEKYKKIIGEARMKKQEKTDDLINRVLLPFDSALQDLSSEVPRIQNSKLRKEGDDLIIARRTNAYSVIPKTLYMKGFGTKTSVNFTVSIRDLPVIKEILVHLKEVNPSYSVGAKLSTYMFKEEMKKKTALEYQTKKGLLLGSDRQVTVSFIPRNQAEEKTIITTIKHVIKSIPKGQMVWQYNNVHVYRTHRGDEDFQGELGFNVKETRNHVLLVSSRRKIKGFERFSVEVVTW
jgi:hypothetical protein